ncbi:MAG: hypothetical protein CMJ49_12770 [Planctomycetaceae bacterium]|nr:hypothetical protein [Planctomycetaceae bacterium]
MSKVRLQTGCASSQRERGIAMLLVLIAVGIAVVLSASLIVTQNTATGVQANAQHHTHARMIAESAMEMAVAYIQNNDDWRTVKTNGVWLSDQALNGGTFTLTGVGGDEDGGDGDLADDASDQLYITVVGTFEGATHTVRAVVQPESSSRKLLLVTSPADPLSSEDAARKAQFEQWGWTVTVIDDDASSADVDQALADNDVVYVAENTNANDADEDLEDSPIGVVNEDTGLWDALGLASTDGLGTSYDTIYVKDNTHYTTSQFSLGYVQIFSSSQPVGYTSSLTSGASNLCSYGSNDPLNASMATLEKGATQADGSPAPARRVCMPIGGSSFDWNALNSNGLTLIERCIEWASGGNAQTQIAYENFGYSATSDIAGAGASGGTGWSGAWYGQANAVALTSLTYLDLDTDSNKLTTGGAGQVSARLIDTSEHTDLLVNDKFGKDDTTIWLSFVVEPGSDASDTFHTWAMLMLDDDWSGTGGFQELLGIGQPWEAGQWGVDDDSGNRDLSSVNVTSDAFIVVRIDFQSGDDQVSMWVNPTDLVNEPSTWSAHASETVDDFAFDRVAISGGMNGSHGVGYGFDEIRIGRTWTSVTPREPGSDQPQLVLLYEFNEVINEPQLLHHWKLDDDGTGGGGAAGDSITIGNSAFIDSYDSTQGAYGGGNVNSNAFISTNSTSAGDLVISTSGKIFGSAHVGEQGDPGSVISAPAGAITGPQSALPLNASMPSASAPAGMPVSEGDTSLNSDTTINTDRAFGDLTISGNHTVVTIDGDVRIHCQGEFEVRTGAEIVVPIGSSLSVYSDEGMSFENSVAVNSDTTGTDRLSLFMLNSAEEISVEQTSVISGRIHSNGDVEIGNNCKVYGSIVALDDLVMTGTGELHIDEALPAVGPAPAGDEVASHDGSIAGATTGVSGQDGTAVDFDGSDFVLIPHSDSMLLDAGTVSLWFNSDSLSGHKAIFSKDSTSYDTGGHFHVYTYGSTLNWRLQSTSSSYTLSSGGLSTDTWYHVVATFGPGGMKLYLNGLLVDSNSYAGGMGTSSGGIGNYEPLALGAGTWLSDNLSHETLTYYFDGTIDDVRIYRYGLDANQVSNLNAGQAIGPSSGPGTEIVDTSGFGTAVNLDLETTTGVTWVSGGGLHAASENRAISSGAATKLYDALTATDELTVEIICQPDNLTQGGPARIVSYSDGAYVRNFTVGQEGQKYLTRLRTTSSTSNGMPNIESSYVLTTGEQHIVMTYDGENVKMYRDGVLEVTGPRTGTFDGWDSDYKFMLFNEDGTSRDWLGTLTRVAVYDRALNALQVDDVFNGSDPGDYSSQEVTVTNSVRWIEGP